MLAIGLLTRVAALFQIPILLGAVFSVSLPQMLTLEPRQNLEFAALVLFPTVLVAVRGAGRCSLDYYLSVHGPDRPVVPDAAHADSCCAVSGWLRRSGSTARHTRRPRRR